MTLKTDNPSGESFDIVGSSNYQEEIQKTDYYLTEYEDLKEESFPEQDCGT